MAAATGAVAASASAGQAEGKKIHLMTPVGFVRNMETVVKGRMPTWKKTAIRRAMESSGSLQGESGSSGLSLSPMCYVDLFTGYVTHLE